ncbi:DUF6716 putative glycosyltransferase [Psychrobacter sp. NC44]|uniref:DUF6716 putative glycosyltransferase n=1 Tax=Psychrobacter sp. NC44 TaxID=2774130 RepID=UPI0039B73EA7
MTNILIISDTDSRIKWSRMLAESLSNYYSTSSVRFMYRGNESYDFSILDSKKSWNKLQDANILIIALGGGANHKYIRRVRDIFELSKFSRRPIIITGYNGITDPYNIHSLNCRLGSDIVCVNTLFDYEVFNDYLKKLDYKQSPIHLLGFLQNTSTATIKFFAKYEPYERKVVFIVQPDVPKSLTERFYIIEKLVELAKKYPSWGIFIKARSQVGENNVTHQESHHYEIIYKLFKQLDNIHFIYGDMLPILDSLENTDLVLSIGSTVIMHCLKRGIHVGVISDFGVRVDYGTEHFVGSNIFIEFDEISNLTIQRLIPNQKWMNKYINFNDDFTTSNLYKKIEVLFEKQEFLGNILPFPEMIYDDCFAKYLSSRYSLKKSERIKFKFLKNYPILSGFLTRFK